MQTQSRWMRTRYIVLLTLLFLVPIVRGYFFGRRRAREAYADVDIYNLVNIIATLLMAGVLLGRRTIASNLRILRGPTGWLVLYYVFCALSSLWSPKPVYTAFRAMELGVLLLFMGHVLSVINNPRAALLYLIRLATLVALLGYLAHFILYGGVIQHNGTYTTCGAFGAVLALASIKRGVLRFADVKYSLIACFATVILGTSSASNVSLIVGILVIAASSKQHIISSGKMLLLSVIVFFILTQGFEVVRPYIFPGKDMKNIKTFTGRTTLFLDYWKAIKKRPFLGYGFAAGERSIEVLGGVITNWTHNSVVSVATNTGIVGVLLFGMAFLGQGHVLYREDMLGNRFAYPILVAIMVGLLNSMSHPIVGSTLDISTTPFLGIVAYTSVYLSLECRTTIPFRKTMTWQF